MNFLWDAPPKNRFYAVLVCLSLIYLIMKGVTLAATRAAEVGGISSAEVVVGLLFCIAAVKMQRIAVAIVGPFVRG